MQSANQKLCVLPDILQYQVTNLIWLGYCGHLANCSCGNTWLQHILLISNAMSILTGLCLAKTWTVAWPSSLICHTREVCLKMNIMSAKIKIYILFAWLCTVGRKSGNTKGFKGRKLHSERTNVCSIVCSAFQLGKMYIL